MVGCPELGIYVYGLNIFYQTIREQGVALYELFLRHICVRVCVRECNRHANW